MQTGAKAMVYIPNNHAYHVFRHMRAGDPEVQTTSLGTFWDSGSDNLLLVNIQISDAYVADVMNRASNAVTYLGARTVGRDASGDLFEVEQAYAAPGVQTGEVIPQNSCPLVRKVTAMAGRNARGRFFPPIGVRESVVDSLGILTSGEQASLQSAFNDFYTDLTTGSLNTTPVILHPTPVGLPIDITQFVVEPQIATQRRRMRS